MKNYLAQKRATRKQDRINRRNYDAVASIRDPRVRAEVMAALNR